MHAGGGRPQPTPRMDWNELRQAKQKCDNCVMFDPIIGGCKLKYLPDINCKSYQEKKETGVEHGHK